MTTYFIFRAVCINCFSCYHSLLVTSRPDASNNMRPSTPHLTGVLHQWTMDSNHRGDVQRLWNVTAYAHKNVPGCHKVKHIFLDHSQSVPYLINFSSGFRNLSKNLKSSNVSQFWHSWNAKMCKMQVAKDLLPSISLGSKYLACHHLVSVITWQRLHSLGKLCETTKESCYNITKPINSVLFWKSH